MTKDKIIIEVNDPLIKRHKKFDAAVAALAKAMRVSEFGHAVNEKSEPTPYTALHELSEMLRRQVGSQLRTVFNNIVRTWMHIDEIQKSINESTGLQKASSDDIFKLNDKIFINPKTGRPLTTAEYTAIVEDINKCFTHLFGATQDALVKQAMALGKILQSMDAERAVHMTFSDAMAIDVASPTESELHASQMAFANQHTAEMLQDISSTARKRVISTIVDAQKNGKSSRQLESDLFNTFSDLNRDWRRVAETETANNFNNGYLSAQIMANKDRGTGGVQFMRGISGAGACVWCKENVKGTVVVLLETAPSDGDTVVIEGKEYTAIWPGKSNFGRKRDEWWVAAGTQHPHCRCSWIEYTPGFEEDYKIFDDMMNKLNAGEFNGAA